MISGREFGEHGAGGDDRILCFKNRTTNDDVGCAGDRSFSGCHDARLVVALGVTRTDARRDESDMSWKNRAQRGEFEG